jgi:hypothetical protein
VIKVPVITIKLSSPLHFFLTLQSGLVGPMPIYTDLSSYLPTCPVSCLLYMQKLSLLSVTNGQPVEAYIADACNFV